MGGSRTVNVRRRTGRHRLVTRALFAATLASACGELGVESTLEPALTGLSVSTVPTTVLEADTIALTVSVQGPSGFVLDSLRATSSNPAVLTALANRVSRSVSLIAVSPGTAELEVTAFASGNGLRASVQRAAVVVTVGQARAACSGATLQLPRSTLWVGELLQATPTVARESATVALAGEQYVSSAPSVVEVTAAGTVRGLRTGTAELSFAVTCSGSRLRTQRVEARLPVTVTNETITLSVARDSAKLGRTGQASVTVGNVRPNGATGVTWISRNTAVATAAGDGSWQAVGVGRTYLVARSDAGGQAQDSIDLLVDDGCNWIRPLRLGETVRAALTGSGPCSRSERVVLDLSAPSIFEIRLSAGSESDVWLTRAPDGSGGWPSMARAGQLARDLYALPAGRHELRLDNFQQTPGSFELSPRLVSNVRCDIKVARGVTVAASIDEQCDVLAVYVVDPTPAGGRTTLRVTSSAFPSDVELLAWDPQLRVVSRAEGSVGGTAVVDFVTPVPSSMNALIRSRTAARGALVFTIDP